MKPMSDTKMACLMTEQILSNLRLQHPRRRRIPGADGKLVWIRPEAARIAIERLAKERPVRTSVQDIVALLERPRSRRRNPL